MKTKERVSLPLFAYAWKAEGVVYASSSEDAASLVNECLNRGTCGTTKMQRRVKHKFADIKIADDDSGFKL